MDIKHDLETLARFIKPKAKSRYINMSLKMKLILLISTLLIGMLLILGQVVTHLITDTVETQIGKRALSVSQSIALMPEVQAAFYTEDPSTILQPIIEPIRQLIGAEFIVIGNTDGIRYTHPLPERIGNEMVGGDNAPALEDGIFYVSKAVGSLGPSLRGKGPIRGYDGEIVGIISVGFLVDDIETTISAFSKEWWMIVLLFIGVGMIGCIWIAHQFKKQIFGLEPYQIAHLFMERNAILQSIHEGIIAINREEKITMVNPAAEALLFKQRDHENPVGQHIQEILPHTKMLSVLKTGESHFNEEMMLGNHIVVVNRVPIIADGEVTGVVASFRNKSEIDRLTRELSHVKQYVDALRTQTHEFSNRLYTISGLLQLNKVKEAIQFINQESRIQQENIQFLIENIKDAMISSILIGKLNAAAEAKVKLTISPESQLHYQPTQEKAEAIITIIGNIIQNAIEAAQDNDQRAPQVNVFITDIGHDVIFEVEDSGKGVTEHQLTSIFRNGYTTKSGANRGIGLAIVQRTIESLHGQITLEEGSLGGACFTIVIPKDNR